MKQMIDNKLIKVNKGYNSSNDAYYDELNICDGITINPAYGDPADKEITIGVGNGVTFETYVNFNANANFNKTPSGIGECHYSTPGFCYNLKLSGDNGRAYTLKGYIIHGNITVAAGGVIETLPTNFRPAYNTTVTAHTEDGTDAIITIEKNGQVKCNKALTNQAIFISVQYI